ncbi:MAG: hypothetical protein BroJett026_37430 [Betaproteobacteria bacterium]|nr:MAG: hypothetical protein BroJett026_37430 [Betaproteobacteria bacterium]
MLVEHRERRAAPGDALAGQQQGDGFGVGSGSVVHAEALLVAIVVRVMTAASSHAGLRAVTGRAWGASNCDRRALAYRVRRDWAPRAAGCHFT